MSKRHRQPFRPPGSIATTAEPATVIFTGTTAKPPEIESEIQAESIDTVNIQSEVIPVSEVKMRAKCSQCRKVYEMTSAQMKQAKVDGVATSPCCNAIATVEKTTVKLK